MYNRKELLKNIKRVVERELKLPREQHFEGTYFWNLHKDDKSTWAIVLAWQENIYEFGDKVLFGKVAFQSNTSMMQCDYDVDWLYPYNEETGDCDDTEVSFHLKDNIEREINWLLDCYESYLIDDEDKLKNDGWEEVGYANDPYNAPDYTLFRKSLIDNNGRIIKGIWKAKHNKTGKIIDITYDQALGYEHITDFDTPIKKLSRELGKMLLPQR